MGMDGLDDVYKYNRFDPTVVEAVTHFLPRLIAGSPLRADKLIHHIDIYSCEPKDLAYWYAPAPHAASTGDRFFFTMVKRKMGSSTRSARVAGAGTWTANKTKSVFHKGVKVGEVKSLSFKKEKACTGWVMEEFRCLLPEAVVADGEKVLCKIHLSSSSPCPIARQESAAYMHRREAAEPPVQEPDTVTVTASPQVQKRPAPVAAARQESASYMHRQEGAEPDTVTVIASPHMQKRPAPVAAADLSCFKKMRMADPVQAIEEEGYQDCPDCSAPPAPISFPAAGSVAAEAEEDMGWCSFTLDELVRVPEEENKEQAVNYIEQFVPSEPVSDWQSEDFEELWADDDEEEAERQAKEAEEFRMELEKSCNAADAHLHSQWLNGRNQNQFFSFASVS